MLSIPVSSEPLFSQGQNPVCLTFSRIGAAGAGFVQEHIKVGLGAVSNPDMVRFVHFHARCQLSQRHISRTGEVLQSSHRRRLHCFAVPLTAVTMGVKSVRGSASPKHCFRQAARVLTFSGTPCHFMCLLKPTSRNSHT